jgi:hypothetical protein
MGKGKIYLTLKKKSRILLITFFQFQQSPALLILDRQPSTASIRRRNSHAGTIEPLLLIDRRKGTL